MNNCLLFLIILIMPFTQVFSQTYNQTTVDEKSQMKVMTGLWTVEALKSSELFMNYFQTEYRSYTPDTTITTQISKVLTYKPVKITIVMGSWCGDSQEQVPRFLKVLDYIGFSETNLTIICVDRNKKSLNGEEQNLSVQLVPTFIIYSGSRELGRIIETPKETLEKDILTIVK